MAPTFPIIDLHCDLLHAMAHYPEKTPCDLNVRCAFPQLRAGGVMSQVFAIFEYTAASSELGGVAQCDAFCRLLERYPEYVQGAPGDPAAWTIGAPTIARVAIENASAICSETEPLAAGIARLERIRRRVGSLVYVGLTWGHENRFGGGNDTTIGLKDDGRQLLEYLAEHQIAVDFSHTSDALAADILQYRAQRNLPLRLLASHSPLRAICDVPRNLPDEFVQEIVRADGVVGLNWIRYFIGDSPADYVRHIEHAIALGAAKHLCLGADFFFDDSLTPSHQRTGPDAYFFPGYESAAHYPQFLALLAAHFGAESALIPDLAYRNALRFLETVEC